MTKEEILAADERVAQPQYLSEYAARAAVEQLAANWECALRDGYKLPDLLHDIDDTMLILEELYKTLLERSEGA